jgi:hypothetical protein
VKFAERWEESLHDLTPFELREGIWWKREDHFAPLGYGGINGSKLRQCIALVSAYAAQRPERAGLISGASVKSPQLSMGALVARHYGLPSLLVVGGTKVETHLQHENVAIAAQAGAQFHFAPVGYNPALRRELALLRQQEPFRNYFLLEYGIPVVGPDAAIESFHRLGSEQMANLPGDVERLYVPAGSCNSCVSMLYGIARFRPRNLRDVVLFGIGPTRLAWIEERLQAIERVSGLAIRKFFGRSYRDHRELETAHVRALGEGPRPYRVVHYDLHATHFATYQDEMPFSFAGIEFHPTYEGKVLTYLRRPGFEDFWGGGGAAFWIVGSKPRLAAMRHALVQA